MVKACYILVWDMEVFKAHKVCVKPFAVGLACRIVVFKVVVVDKFALYGIYKKHFSGAESFLFNNLFGRNVDTAYL